ncbi:MAG: 2-phospho-L-lactate transferase [Burkholderiales bacterium]|nr:2-phospho-L-lactate transferase [Burkholderiales bacterium]
MAAGLSRVLPPRGLAVIVNTGDDFEHLGLHLSPDLDSVLYTMAGVADARRGWGRAGESWNFMSAIGELGGAAWFRLGDRDLALHVLRTHLLGRGLPLSEVTRRIGARLGVRHAVLPMAETPVRTRVRTARGVLDFQDYFVRRQCRPRARGFHFAGSRAARVPRGVRRLLVPGRTRAVVICPSNPYVSIAPILSVPALRDWMARRAFPVVAVSPIVGGAAVKGPAAKIMRELGEEPSAAGLARHYGPLVDGWVVDRRDAAHARAIAREGHAVVVTDTVMDGARKAEVLARTVVAFARSLTRSG